MMTLTDTRVRNTELIAQYNALFAAKRFADWSLLFQPDCRFEVAYPLPPLPAVLHGRDELVGFIGALAEAVGDVRIDRQSTHHTIDPDVVITEHRLSVELLGGGQYQNQYISVIQLRDGLIAEVREYYGSIEHAAFVASLA
ncbi:nuclear transport factor 2 family protein [Dactylosporangium sp. NPDC049525]|uniref:nuclear transport factor 2 family protein n=1 Tax=Dactylosporangium sp. NPDC049525 TaxID=3154730 RepID=UPI00342330FE